MERMKTLSLNCPTHLLPLSSRESAGEYLCPSGCSFQKRNGITRFVSSERYAASFGIQWNEFRATQLDSFTGLTISHDRLKRLLGGSFDILKGKQVLEAGCGAGRFTEILLDHGAYVCAVDISEAVEANYKNCCKYDKYFVAQANILELPFEPGQFDIVVCIGVIQHTPDPEVTMQKLCEQVKPGGILIIDHYTYGYSSTLSRRMLRALLLKMPKKFSLKFCKIMTNFLWPLHSLLWKVRAIPFANQIRTAFLKVSPIVDYHDAYPQLGPKVLKIWAALDTHDTLTDYYKHLRSAEEIGVHLKRCGMVDIETSYAGNGVEAKARKPIASHIPPLMQEACIGHAASP